MPLSKIVAKSITDDTITTDQIADTSVHGRRNLVINGAFQIFQRATAATTATTTYSTADRFVIYEATDGSMTTEKSSDHPFSGSSLKAQVTGADTSIAAGQFAYIYQNIEAQNLQHLFYGTSSAKTLTLSFYVKSSKTGVYTVHLDKQDGTGYIFVQEYTISSANTWEKKTITITPDSNIKASGAGIDNDTGTGLSLGFGLVWGSNTNGGTSGTWSARSNAHYGTSNQVNWMDSTSNNFYLTEVQLEVGEQATPFEHRSFGEELALCQRYFQTFSYMNGYTHHMFNSTQAYGFVQLPGGPMRATPSASLSDTGSDTMHVAGSSKTISGVAVAASRPDGILHRVDLSSSATAGHAAHYDNNSTPYILISAEL